MESITQQDISDAWILRDTFVLRITVNPFRIEKRDGLSFVSLEVGEGIARVFMEMIPPNTNEIILTPSYW